MEVKANPDKYASRAAAATPEYESGVRNPRRSQSQAAIAAEGNYETGVTAAIGRKAFSTGLQKSGDAAWLKGALEKGRGRYGQGVQAGKDAYRAGFEPFAAVLRSTELSPRGPKGQNYGRVQQVGDALRNKKLTG